MPSSYIIRSPHLVILTLLLFSFVLLKNAWLCEDFWIGARQVEQLFAGNGLRWNTHERVQLFTSVLGFFLTVVGRVFTADYFINFAAQALIFNTLLLVLLAKLLRSSGKYCVAVLLLLASNTFMDFTWSGLHNIVGHAMIVGYLLLWKELALSSSTSNSTIKFNVVLLAIAVGLAPLFRHDFAILVWPPAAMAFWRYHGLLQNDLKAALIFVFLLPLTIWTTFSLVYFGFPFPLSAYAKLGGDLPRIEWIINGAQYYLYTISTDFPTFIVILVALLMLMFCGGYIGRSLAAGMLLHLFYTAYSGADYMGGRFFTYVYLLSVIALVTNGRVIYKPIDVSNSKVSHIPRFDLSNWKRYYLCLPAACAVIWMFALEHTPLKSPLYYGGRDEARLFLGGIADERSGYHYSSNILSYIEYKRGNTNIFPNHYWVLLGKIAARSNAPVIHVCNMGMTPYNMRLDQKIIDVNGFSDALQARLPGLSTRPGHILRRLPQGYLKSVAENDALIADYELNEYYKKLRTVTQSPQLFTYERLSAIIAVNTQVTPTDGIHRGPPFTGPLLCKAIIDKETFLRLKQDIENISAETLNRSDLSS